MTSTLKCPSCNAQMEITFLAPGDKAARCPYCGTLVDLSEPAGVPFSIGHRAGAARKASNGARGDERERVAEVEEEKVGDGFRVRRVVRVSEKTASTTGAPEVDDLLEEARRMLGQSPSAGNTQSWSTTRVVEEASTTTRRDLLNEDMEDLLSEAQAMLRDMSGSSTGSGKQRRGAPPDPGTSEPDTQPRTGQDARARPADPPSATVTPWWKRLFRRD